MWLSSLFQLELGPVFGIREASLFCDLEGRKKGLLEFPQESIPTPPVSAHPAKSTAKPTQTPALLLKPSFFDCSYGGFCAPPPALIVSRLFLPLAASARLCEFKQKSDKTTLLLAFGPSCAVVPGWESVPARVFARPGSEAARPAARVA